MPASQFPTLLAAYAQQPRYLARFEDAVGKLEQGITAGAIANPVYQDVKGTISRAFDDGFEKAIQEPFFWAGRWESLSDADKETFWAAAKPAPHTIGAWQKKLAKAQDSDLVEALRAFIAEVAPLGEMVVKAKDLVVKRQPKAPEADVRAKYVAPEASRTGMKQVFDLLTSITEAARADLVTLFQNRFQRYVDRFMEAQAECKAMEPAARKKKYPHGCTPYDLYRNRQSGRMNMEAYEVVEACTKVIGYGGRDSERAVREDAAARIATMATKLADEVRENFVTKNLKKLDSIIERKGDLDEAKVVGKDISMQGLEGTLRFTFKDGAAFTCRNSVVFAYSVHGTPFQRFPLTFHDVTKSDGSKMKSPSEEKMNTEFLGI